MIYSTYSLNYSLFQYMLINIVTTLIIDNVLDIEPTSASIYANLG